MKRIPALFALLASLFTIQAQTFIDSGNVAGTWTKENSPYHIMGDIHVQQNQMLTIEPGVRVVFQGHYRIHLHQANILAFGSPEDSIVFTVADTTGFANGGWDEGGWKGINIQNPSTNGDTSHFAWCRFEFAKIPGEKYSREMGVIGLSSIPRLTIRDCMFYRNKTQQEGIIDIHFSDLIIRHNVFRRNQCSELVSMQEDSPHIYRNRIDSNNFEVAFWITAWNHPEIHHNMIIHNTGSIFSAEGNCRPRFYLNWVLNNDGAAVNLHESRSAVINNLIANNNLTAITCDRDRSAVIQNTIVNNYDPSGPVVDLVRTATLFNGNIFNNNSTAIRYQKGEMKPVFRYNMFDFDTSVWIADHYTGIYENNLENDAPHFVQNTGGQGIDYNAEFADFNIAPLPNIVNKGDPNIPEEYVIFNLFDGPRIMFGRIDIGAYEAWQDKVSMPSLIFQDTVLIADTVEVLDDVFIQEGATLTIYAGATVLFHGYDSIAVRGSIEAIGTEDEPILFTVADTTGFSGEHADSGAWKGIVIDNEDRNMSGDPCRLEYCIFEYAKSLIAPANDPYRGGALSLRYYDDLVLRNCEFRNNYSDSEGHAIYGWQSWFDIVNCTFHHHIERERSTRGTVSMTNSIHKIVGCTFHSNHSYDGASLYLFDCGVDINNCHFYNNSTVFTGFASCLSARGSTVKIRNSLFNNNWTNNEGIIYFSSSEADIINSTIVNNLVGWEGTSAGISLARTDLSIYNSILYGNASHSDTSSIMLLEENSDPNLFNTLIQGGVEGIKPDEGFHFTGALVDCINEDPHFRMPSTGIGPVDSAWSWDWSLLDISPCLNTGTPDTTGFMLPGNDLGGNDRFIGERIDLGAFEKSGHLPEIDKQPVGGNFCTGDSIVISLEYSKTDTAFLQWQKDGMDLPGANNNQFVLYPANADHTGNYVCRLQNSYGFVYSLPVFLRITEPPYIQSQPQDAWVEPGKQLSMEVKFSGTEPVDILWTLDGQDLKISTPEYRFTPVDSSFEGSYACMISNACGTVETDPVNIYLAPQLCIVTVSTTTGHNLVVWEKNTKAPIGYYNVYRESAAAGFYDRLVSQPFEQLSVYTDTIADPTVQGFIYKVTAVDTSGYETDADLCKPHKTIHLLVSTNPELHSTQLEWDRYVGFDYLTYKIFRSTNSASLEEVHSLSSSFNSWTDPDPLQERQFYRIAVEKPIACVPEGSGKKAGTGPYQHALSNMDDNKLKMGHAVPDTITISNQSIEEGMPPGTFIGKLFTADEDSLDSHKYKFVPGEGSEDNISFTIAGDLLLTSEEFDYETKNQYKIRIRSTDEAGNYYELSFSINVIDIDETTGLPATQKNKITVYPNPFSHSTRIIFPNQESDTYMLILSDLAGNVLIRRNITGNLYILQKDDLAAGYYLLELRGRKTYRCRIVVN